MYEMKGDLSESEVCVTFGQLRDQDVAAAYSIIQERYDFLVCKDIDQYPYPYPPLDIYRRDQELGRNYALYRHNRMLGIISVRENECTADWSGFAVPDVFLWITSLFTSIAERGNSHGYRMLDHVVILAQRRNFPWLLLDCYKDGNFLVSYYQRYGFESLGEKRSEFSKRSFVACPLGQAISVDATDA